MLEIETNDMDRNIKIMVAGIGDVGINEINMLIDRRVRWVEFAGIHTDKENLNLCTATRKLQIGQRSTMGMGAGTNPNLGRKAARESLKEIRELLKGIDILYVVCGMGEGTGSGATPVITETAKKMGILTICIAWEPYKFESEKMKKNTAAGIDILREKADTLIVLSRDKAMESVHAHRRMTLPEFYRKANDITSQPITAIADLFNDASTIICPDFSDVQALMRNQGFTVVGSGTGQGKTKAEQAVKRMCADPYLNKALSEARGVIVYLYGDISLSDAYDVVGYVSDEIESADNIIYGARYDESMTDTCKVTMIAVGLESQMERRWRNIMSIKLHNYSKEVEELKTKLKEKEEEIKKQIELCEDLFFDVEQTSGIFDDPLLQQIYKLSDRQRETLLAFLQAIDQN